MSAGSGRVKHALIHGWNLTLGSIAAFIPSFALANSSGTEIGTSSNPIYTAGSTATDTDVVLKNGSGTEIATAAAPAAARLYTTGSTEVGVAAAPLAVRLFTGSSVEQGIAATPLRVRDAGESDGMLHGYLTSAGLGAAPDDIKSASTAYYAPASSKVGRVFAIKVKIADTSATVASALLFGSQTALTTGISVLVTASDGSTLVRTVFAAAALKSNLDLITAFGDGAILGVTTKNGVWAVYRPAKPIVLTTQQRLKFTNAETSGVTTMFVEIDYTETDA